MMPVSYTSGVGAGPGARARGMCAGEREQDTLLWAIMLLLGGVSF